MHNSADVTSLPMVFPIRGASDPGKGTERVRKIKRPPGNEQRGTERGKRVRKGGKGYGKREERVRKAAI